MELYIHFPFCRSKCRYCDFNSYAGVDAGTVFSYFSALKKEIRMASEQFGRAKVTSAYLGGGTPNLLDKEKIASVCEELRRDFDLTNLKEFTIECNPESMDEEKLETYRRCGIDRISIGVQSLDDRNLKSVGRIHDSKRAMESLRLARKFFDNVSCDVMIGLPYDDPELVRSELLTLAPQVEHMSVYQLTLEEGTPLAARVKEGRTLLPDDDEVAELMDEAIGILRGEGFERYEISNFAREGRRSVHNFGYWTREEYLGFGAGAASLVKTSDGISPLEKELRFSSPKDIHAYIGGVNCVDSFDAIPRMDFEVLGQKEIDYEEIMLGLRTADGVDKRKLQGRIPPVYMRFFKDMGDRLALNDEGMEKMNGVLTAIL